MLLTTQYLDEADQLADRIAVIDRGLKVAEGTPDELKSQVGTSTLQLRLLDPAQTGQAVDVVRRVLGEEPVLTPEAGGINVAAARREPRRRRADRAARAGAAHHLRDRAEAHPRRGVHGAHRPRAPRTSPTPTTTRRSWSDDPALHHGRRDRHRDHAGRRAGPAGPPVGRATPSARPWRWPGGRLKKMRRNPEQFFDVTIQPLLFTAMFAYIFGGAISGRRRRATCRSSSPASVAQTALTACMATGIQLREDMDKGVFDRFKSLPIARIAPLAGPMLADLLRYAIAATLTIVTGIVDGLPPRRRRSSACSAAVVLTIFAGWSLAWIFTWLGTIARSAQARAGHLDDDHVPADVPVQRVRPGRDAAGLAAGLRRTSTRSRTSSPRSAT